MLDLAKEEGREIMRRLVAGADVLVESFTPRVMANYGLGYDDLKQIKPDLIMCSLSGYGQDGPMRDYGAYGMGLEPASGLSSITGYAGGPPIRSRASMLTDRTPASPARARSRRRCSIGAVPARDSTSTSPSRRRRSRSWPPRCSTTR
jgi:crotonobetainyl-CoA:carnitine CoA-transferase CaiB-like acyl-CoA transferase